MIRDSEIEKIDEIITSQINLGDDFEGTEEEEFLKNNFSDIEYLPIFHQMLASNSPSFKLHIFSFNKIEYIINNFSNDWTFSKFNEINGWIVSYIRNFSDIVIDSPKLLFDSLINCYTTLVKTAISKYPFFQDFWNSIVQFTTTIYTNNASTSFISLFILRQLLELSEEAENSKETKNLTKSDTKKTKNRETVFTYSMQILELILKPKIEDATEKELAELALDTTLGLRSFGRSVNFRIFFSYSNTLSENETALKMCEICLNEGKEELDGRKDELSFDAVIAVEDGIIEEKDEDENPRFLLAVESKMHLLYYSKFVEILGQRNATFSIRFLEKLEIFASNLIRENLFIVSPETFLNFLRFFTLYESENYQRPSESIKETVFASVLNAAESEHDSFAKLFEFGESNEDQLSSLISLLFRFDFSELASRINEKVSAILELKKSNSDEKVTLVFSLLIRIIEKTVSYIIDEEKSEFIEEFVMPIISIQNDILIPILEQRITGQFDGTINFSDEEILSILLFDKFFVEADEISLLQGISTDEYGDAIKMITTVSHAVLMCLKEDSKAVEVALAVFDAVCSRKYDTVFIDNDWMLEDQNQIQFDFSIIEGFYACESFNKSLFFHELKQTQPRIEVFIEIALRGLIDLVEEIKNEGDELKTEKEKKQREKDKRALFSLIIAQLSGILQAFDQFCSQNKKQKFKLKMENEEEKADDKENETDEEEEEEEEEAKSEEEKFIKEEANKEEEEKFIKEEAKNEAEKEKSIKEEAKEEEEEEKSIKEEAKNEVENETDEDEEENETDEDEEEEDIDEESTEINQAAISHGLSIINSLCPGSFEAIVSIAENLIHHIANDIDDYTIITEFIIFSTRFASILHKQFFDKNSPLPHQIFKSLTSFVRTAIEKALSQIRSANQEESKLLIESEQQFTEFNLIREKNRSILVISVKFAAVILGNDSVSFGAFILYEDSSYKDFIFAVSDAVDSIGVNSIIEDEDKSELGIQNIVESLLESLYTRHLSLISQKPGFERFDNFFNETLKLIAVVEKGGQLLEILVHELSKINIFNLGVCEPFLAVRDILDSLVGDVFDEVFLNKNSEAGSSRLFGEYACICDGFAYSISPRALSSCSILKKASISKILNDITEASEKRNVTQAIELFDQLHSTWF